MIIKGRGTARELGINVVNRSEKTLFHWFMCVILFSKPVQQEIAGNAFLLLKQYGYDTPDYILKAKWKEIVNTLGKAHYVRHDESTATRLLEASKLLVGQYDGCIKAFVNEYQNFTVIVAECPEALPLGLNATYKDVSPEGDPYTAKNPQFAPEGDGECLAPLGRGSLQNLLKRYSNPTV